MSKKKAFGGSTMTLKDFHGGSIPSDIPLPSAPGAVVRPSDRSGFDRHTSWGNPTGRPDYRSRPNSSPATRNFDDKTPFLAHTVHIGRNFDEDERKPLDGVSAPRRTVSDENINVPLTRVEPKTDYTSSGRLAGRQVSTPVSQLPSASASSYSARLAEATQGGSAHVGVIPGNSMGHGGQAVSGSYPNAWAARKEAVGIAEPGQSAWSGSVAESKFAQASALEKVSSGRWQSKHSVHHQPDVEVIRHSETESSLHTKGGIDNYALNGMDVVNGGEHYDASLARHAERGLTIKDGFWAGGRDVTVYGSARSNIHREAKERNPQSYNDGVQVSPTNGKSGRSEFQPPVPSDAAERPKLKLLPASKRLDGLEQPVNDYKLGHNWSSDPIHAETVTELYGNTNPARTGLAGTETESRAAERPKLNLKPRTQSLERLEGNVERERNTLFGGARPRELVLKERGIDEVAINNHDVGQSSIRVKHDGPKSDMIPGNAVPTRLSEKTTNLPLDDRIGKTAERKDHRVETDRADVQRRNWRNDNRKNIRETEKPKPQQHQQQERLPSPETWRKPAEQPRPASPDANGLRYGKVASAVELAQAFSSSVSDQKTTDRLSTQRALPGRGQMPFSRLMGSGPRPQINGY